MKYINFAVLKFSVCLALGIITARFAAFTEFLLFPALLPIWIVLIITYWMSRKQLYPSIFFGIITFAAFFTLGIVSYQSSIPKFQKSHFSHSEINASEVKLLQVKINEVLKPDNYYLKYLAETEAVDQEKTRGKILIYIQKDSLFKPLDVDTSLLLQSTFSKIPKPLNPEQFSYDHYMANLGVYHQLKIESSEIIKRFSSTKTLKGSTLNYRNTLVQKLRKTILTKEVRGILQALVLGEKQDIEKELYEKYAAAGAVHILAVSGLHVGIIFLLLSTALKPLKRLRYGNWIVSITILFLLWGFALIAGLSASVVRAVTMFSFLALAKILNRPTSSLNTLSLSFFILLLINPKWLFQVGFQLSYLAVFFILWVQPMLYKLYKPRFYLDRLLWSIVTVSIAAQLGVFPLSLYYFNQVSGLFLLTNIVILPFLGLLLLYGLLIVLLIILDKEPDTMLSGYNLVIDLLNRFIEWVASQGKFIVDDISISLSEVILFYAIICFIILVLQTKKIKFINPLLVSIFTLILVLFKMKNNYASERLIVFHKSRQSIICYEQDRKLTIFSSDSSKFLKQKYPLKNYLIKRKVEEFRKEKNSDLYKYKNESLLVVDSVGVYEASIKVDIILLTHSPKVNLERMIDSICPRLIIADGSNYRSYIERWQKTCEIKKLPFHHTGTKGAFIWE